MTKTRRLRFSAAAAAGLLILLGASACRAEAISREECLSCHSDFDEARFTGSAHGRNECTSCHKTITEIPHEETLPKVDCASCHRLESQVYMNSDHGRARAHGSDHAASCKECHGTAHHIPAVHAPDSPVNRANIAGTCAACHEDESKMAGADLLEKKPFQTYLETVHGKAFTGGNASAATCTDCHGSHDLHSPRNDDSKMNRKHVPETCGKCHENVLRAYQMSVHGKAAAAGKTDAPVCTDCHGEHTILKQDDPRSSIYPPALSEKVCARCHAAERIISKYHLPADRVRTYMESYHGIASSRFGVATVANCASCHGAHDILPSADALSSVNKRNLAQTCGKCHPNASDQLTKGTVHILPTTRSGENIAYWVRVFYLFLIGGAVGGMVVHNLLDFFHKLRVHYLKRKGQGGSLRFSRSERIQHGVLAAAFIGLAYTGFALRYSSAWWALPVAAAAEGGVDWRGGAHRACAIVFSLLAVYHLGYAALTARGRQQLRAIGLRASDLKEAAAFIAFNLGLRKEKPVFGRYSYIEKIEYWALIWGTVVMMATGAVLAFENWSLRWLPKWLFDVIAAVHFYEAVLATLAILVWHFYFTIFDPDQYPMNWSITTGKDPQHPEQPPDTPPDPPAVS